MNDKVMTKPSEVVLPGSRCRPAHRQHVCGRPAHDSRRGVRVEREAVTNYFVDVHGRSVEVLDFGIDEIIEQDASVALFGTFKIRARKMGTAIEFGVRAARQDSRIARSLDTTCSRTRISWLRPSHAVATGRCSVEPRSRRYCRRACRLLFFGGSAPSPDAETFCGAITPRHQRRCSANTTGAAISRCWNKPTHLPLTSPLSPILSA
jgi:hypothetical protein